MTQLSDEFLLAYIDGQLERRQSGEVSQLASTNAEISRRIARLKRSQAQLIESFGAFAREEIAVPRSALQLDENEGKQLYKGKTSPRAAAQSLAQKSRTRSGKCFLWPRFSPGAFSAATGRQS